MKVMIRDFLDFVGPIAGIALVASSVFLVGSAVVNFAAKPLQGLAVCIVTAIAIQVFLRVRDSYF